MRYQNILHIVVAGEWRKVEGKVFLDHDQARHAAYKFQAAHQANFGETTAQAYVETLHLDPDGSEEPCIHPGLFAGTAPWVEDPATSEAYGYWLDAKQRCYTCNAEVANRDL